ncbi:MAG: carboxymuconolactone decarboxylase family protein [Gemmatimonadetes bacterium]|nr:carboxymuconolactone decarboxylase family protein [Gemmatimonadota bacterium]
MSSTHEPRPDGDQVPPHGQGVAATTQDPVTQPQGPVGDGTVPSDEGYRARIDGLDAPHVALVRVAAAVASVGEAEVRRALTDALDVVPSEWVEEVILQSYLFAGFPRALNAAREWRRVSGRAAPAHDDGERFADAGQWSTDGARTCAIVYGASYERLRHNIRALHPALDAWMIVEGYGKVLSRPGLDLRRRELCIVAACAAAGQDRQLHSHLHGALNAGASAGEVGAVLEAVTDFMAPENPARYRLLLERVVHQDVH